MQATYDYGQIKNCKLKGSYQTNYDNQRVNMYGRLGNAVDLPQRSQRRLKVWPQLQRMPKVQRRLLIVAVRLENLAEGKVLLPRAAVGRLHLERPPRQVNGVIQILQCEQHPAQI